MESFFKHTEQLYSGRWMKLYEQRSLLKKKRWFYPFRWLRWLTWFWPHYTGFCVNGTLHLSEKVSFTNFLIFGKTGSGKSTCSIIPSLLRMTEHSLVVTDPGELWQATSRTLEKRGYALSCINIADPAHSDTFNPMDFARDKSEIRTMVSMLINSAYPNSNGSDEFWNLGAQSILVPLWVALVNQQQEQYKNLANLRMLLLQFGQDGKALDLLISKYCDEESFREYQSFVAQDSKVIQNVLSTAKNALMLFADPAIQRLTATTSINLACLRQQKTALFVKIAEGDIESYQYIIAVIYSAVFKEIMKEPKKSDLSVFCVLDEFANSGVTLLPQLPSIVTQIRKKRAALCMCLQDIGQLEGQLGRAKTSTIVDGGTATKLYMPGMSMEMAQYLERLLGMTTKTYRDQHDQPQEAHRPVMTADELKTMLPHNACVVEFANKRPALLQLHPYYHSWYLRRLTKRKAVVIQHPDAEKPIEFLPLDEL